MTEVRTAAGLANALASTLDARLTATSTEEAIEGIGRTLAGRGPVLVVFDNFEQLVLAGARCVERWLRAAPLARFLVTSRALLDLAGEERWPLEPLPEDAAAALFRARARQVRPDVDLDAPHATGLVGEIVGALDGVPLAIELAASRVAILSPAALRERLRRPLDLLVRQRDDSRHASMRRTILDSVELLSNAERDALAACAVFRGGFTLEGATAVIGEGDVLARIEALVRQSLLRAGRAPEPEGDASELRFSFFETIREVAQDLASAGPLAEASADRHLAYFAGLPADERLGLEQENLLAAHARAMLRGDAARGLSLALRLDPVLATRGLLRLRFQRLDQALTLAEHAPRGVDQDALAEAFVARGAAQRELGDAPLARRDLERGLALASSQPALAALAQIRIGEIVEFAGDTTAAHAYFRAARATLERVPPGALRAAREAEAHLRSAHAYRREGALAEAAASIAEATARYRRLSDDEGLCRAFYEAAVIAMFQGRAESALARFDEGLVIAARAGARLTEGALTTARGGLLQELGRVEEALAHHAAAARVFRQHGSRHREMSALYYLATAYLDSANAREAAKILTVAEDRGQGTAAPRYEALIQGARAVALAALEDAAGAEHALRDAERACALAPGEPALAATLAIHRMTLGAYAQVSPARLDDARALADARPSDDSRFALRMLLAASRPAVASLPASLVVAVDGSAFRPPRAPSPVDLSRRAPLRNIVRLLAERRAHAPGEVVPVDEIILAAWPGEKIRPEAAMNRAHVALATLRKLGLKGALVTGAGGYLLCAGVAVEIGRP